MPPGGASPITWTARSRSWRFATGEAQHPEAEHERDPDRQDPAVWVREPRQGSPKRSPMKRPTTRPMMAVTNSLVERVLTPRMSQRAGTIVR